MDFWEFLGMLWTKGVEFLNLEIGIFGFTLWEFALGAVVLSMVLYAVFRILE